MRYLSHKRHININLWQKIGHLLTSRKTRWGFLPLFLPKKLVLLVSYSEYFFHIRFSLLMWQFIHNSRDQFVKSKILLSFVTSLWIWCNWGLYHSYSWFSIPLKDSSIVGFTFLQRCPNFALFWSICILFLWIWHIWLLFHLNHIIIFQ